MTAVLAIDQGTSTTKALVVAADRTILAIAEVPVRVEYGRDGAVEVDPGQLWDSVVQAGHEALAGAGVPVTGVALANQGETVLAWDRATGRPLSKAIVWQDRRSQPVCERMRGQADLIRERTGLELDPYFSAPKMRWLGDLLDGDGPATRVITTTDSWLVHRLCGAFVTDTSTASRSLLFGLAEADWDRDLLEIFGWADEALPDLVGCDQIVGQTTVFGGSTPVAGLIVDQQAALLAHGCRTRGEAKCTYGTGAFLLAHAGRDGVPHAAGLTTSVAWTLGGVTDYCVDGQVYTVGSAVRWLVDLGLIGAADDLDTVAADSSDGVLCVPAFAGLAAPWWQPQARAVITGLSLGTGRGHLVRAVLDGIAAQVCALIGCVQDSLGTSLPRLRVDGGLTRCRTLMQAQADLAQLPVEVYPGAHATALGAAEAALLALHPDSEQARPGIPATVYQPGCSPGQAADFLGRWNAAAEATR